MNHSVVRAFAALLLAMVFDCTAKEVKQPDSANKSVSLVLKSLVEKKLVAGAVGLVASKDKVLFCEAAGLASLTSEQSMRSNDLFWIASMTKPITAAALMMLVDEGKIDINDPVEKFLPEFLGQQIVQEKPDNIGTPHPPRHPITIREVMNHTSGLVLASDRSLKRLHSLKDDTVDIASHPLRQDPGTRYEYNNCGINTGARIIEVVTGQSYADFMQSRLFDPLGMKDTTFWPNEGQARRLAHSAKRAADGVELEEIKLDKDADPSLIKRLSEGMSVPAPMLADFGIGKIFDYTRHYADPAGGLFSTAEDLSRFCQMILNGGTWQGRRYLSERAIQQMTSVQTGEVPVNPQEAYGLGWSVKIRDDEGLSPRSYGHRGVRRPVMWVDPRNQLIMILLVERFDMTGEEQKVLYASFLKSAIETFSAPH